MAGQPPPAAVLLDRRQYRPALALRVHAARSFARHVARPREVEQEEAARRERAVDPAEDPLEPVEPPAAVEQVVEDLADRRRGDARRQLRPAYGGDLDPAGGDALARERLQAAIKASTLGDFGLTEAELLQVAAKLEPGNSAVIVLFENVWERRFRAIAAKHHGSVVNQQLVSSETLVKRAKELLG